MGEKRGKGAWNSIQPFLLPLFVVGEGISCLFHVACPSQACGYHIGPKNLSKTCSIVRKNISCASSIEWPCKIIFTVERTCEIFKAIANIE